MGQPAKYLGVWKKRNWPRVETEMVKCVLGVGVGLGETFFKDRGQNQPLGLQPILG